MTAPTTTAGVGQTSQETVTVLFVDDEPAVTRAILRVLSTRPDLTALSAVSGDEALGILRSRPIDILVSDIDMPKMTGMELLQVTRREFPATLRVLLTGAGTMTRAVAAINEGEVVRFFTKPFDAELFSHALSELGDRIRVSRRERSAETKRARSDEFFRWVEERHPGALDVKRNDRGEVVIDTDTLRAYLNSASADLRALLGTP